MPPSHRVTPFLVQGYSMGEKPGFSENFGLRGTSGPLPLARGGLGWGPLEVAIPYGIAPLTATSCTLSRDYACMEASPTYFYCDVRSHVRRTPP
ncbi:hypothetical protein [Laspinema olomoucense]|uniref:hypothetical protein n=1 Tax=Laspinema olomoucense TaxID=3231600 RepID=UPI0021BB45D2|nr:hypothetical protein [Laspinema sp. D3a]MCT7990439.1 hypothetical protein [Laspinema sp. D3a]